MSGGRVARLSRVIDLEYGCDMHILPSRQVCSSEITGGAERGRRKTVRFRQVAGGDRGRGHSSTGAQAVIFERTYSMCLICLYSSGTTTVRPSLAHCAAGYEAHRRECLRSQQSR